MSIKPKIKTKLKAARRIEFEDLTPAQKRMAIARDAIAQIKEKALLPSYASGYCSFNGTTFDDWTINQSTLQNLKSFRCSVCAAGALAIAAIRQGNKFDGRGILTAADVADILAKWFRAEQIIEIEAAFEDAESTALSERLQPEGKVKVDLREARQFGRKFEREDKRMLAIFNNIVEHQGEFKP